MGPNIVSRPITSHPIPSIPSHAVPCIPRHPMPSHPSHPCHPAHACEHIPPPVSLLCADTWPICECLMTPLESEEVRHERCCCRCCCGCGCGGCCWCCGASVCAAVTHCDTSGCGWEAVEAENDESLAHGVGDTRHMHRIEPTRQRMMDMRGMMTCSRDHTRQITSHNESHGCIVLHHDRVTHRQMQMRMHRSTWRERRGDVRTHQALGIPKMRDARRYTQWHMSSQHPLANIGTLCICPPSCDV